MALYLPGKTAAERIYGFVENFNCRLRDECLNEAPVTALDHARQVLTDWPEDYITVRPHYQLNGRTPDQVARQGSRGHPPRPLSSHQPQTIKSGNTSFDWIQKGTRHS
ncbi:integrase core domain-containing protein [Acetobacter malorum]|uniref:integrase core domain-containing protein n=1 Tax=Acetobacter malorum TaxID=178901 RepID=UPI0009ED0905